MKRFSTIIFGALAILVVSCSKHAQPEPEFEPWVNDLSLPVPIQFGTPDVAQTKASPVDKASDLAGRWLGVFAINNDPKAECNNSANVLLNNASATYTGGEDAGSLQFIGSSTKDLVTKYYPVKSDINYTFYGYYVQVGATLTDSTTPSITNGVYYVDVDFGSLDYLWAKSVAKDYIATEGTYKGYNAKYIRKITQAKQTTYMPAFAFKHITSMVSFKAKGDSTDSTDDKDFADIQVCSIAVKSAVKKAKLCIANKSEIASSENLQYEGKFFDIDEANKGIINMRAVVSDGSKEFWLPNGETPCVPTVEGEGVTLGQGLFLCPGYTYSIYVYYKSNSTGKSLVELKVDTPKLEAGKKYVYTLVFHKSTKVDISVTLEEWQSGKSEEITDLN